MRIIRSLLLLSFCITYGYSAASKPNILLLFPDQWRYDWTGLNSSDPTGPIPLHVPTLANTIAPRATRFTQAYVPAPVCAPSRACLASGREYDFAKVACNFCNDYNLTVPTFYQSLQQAGYWVMTVGKDDLTKDSQPGENGTFHQAELGFNDGLRCSGKDDVVNQFPKPHEPYGFFLAAHNTSLESGANVSAWDAHHSCLTQKNKQLCDRTSFPDEYYEDNWVAENALTLLERRPKNKPYFLQVNFPGPHPPFVTTARMADSVTNRTWPRASDYSGSNKCPNVPHEPGDGARCNYAAEIENLDRLFGIVLDKVDLSNTLVCVSSDHGEMLDDHGDSGKTMPWHGSVGVPLMCFGPGVLRARTIAAPTATLDLAATFLDYAGAQRPAQMTSVSLRDVLEGRADEPARPFVSSGLQSMQFGLESLHGPLALDVETNAAFNWRMVVKQVNGVSFKFICCKGTCPGKPKSLPGPDSTGYTKILINVDHDRFDTYDVTARHPDVATQLMALLPIRNGFHCT